MTLHTTRPRWLAFATMLLAAIACGDDGTEPPDQVPPEDRQVPQPIDDLSLAWDSASAELVFTWTARRDDAATDRADRYDIRYGGSFPFDWEQSSRVTDPPAPLKAGTPQSYRLPDPRRGHDVYATMRAIDAAGNESATGAVAHVRVPGFYFDATCLNTLTQAPIAGLHAVVTARRVEERDTGADGRISLENLSSGTLGVLFTTGTASPAYHRFDDAFDLGGDTSVMFSMIPYQQPDSPDFTSILSLLYAAIFAPGGHRIVKHWDTYPVLWYARDFVNVNGVDYHALTAQATERWNTRLGFQLFAPAPSDPAVGILLEYLPRSTMGTVNGITDYSNDANGYPVHDRIRIVDDFADEARLYSIFMHELGHTIPLGHLGAGFIMYASQPLPADITDDEVEMVRVMLALPNGTDLGKYDPTPPTP